MGVFFRISRMERMENLACGLAGGTVMAYQAGLWALPCFGLLPPLSTLALCFCLGAAAGLFMAYAQSNI